MNSCAADVSPTGCCNSHSSEVDHRSRRADSCPPHSKLLRRPENKDSSVVSNECCFRLPSPSCGYLGVAERFGDGLFRAPGAAAAAALQPQRSSVWGGAVEGVRGSKSKTPACFVRQYSFDVFGVSGKYKVKNVLFTRIYRHIWDNMVIWTTLPIQKTPFTWRKSLKLSGSGFSNAKEKVKNRRTSHKKLGFVF